MSGADLTYRKLDSPPIGYDCGYMVSHKFKVIGIVASKRVKNYATSSSGVRTRLIGAPKRWFYRIKKDSVFCRCAYSTRQFASLKMLDEVELVDTP